MNEKMYVYQDWGWVALDTRPNIVNVIYNPPATIIHWSDKTKTVVKAQDGDEYNPYTGFLLAVAKRAFGNDNTFNKVLRKWCDADTVQAQTEKNMSKKQHMGPH